MSIQSKIARALMLRLYFCTLSFWSLAHAGDLPSPESFEEGLARTQKGLVYAIPKTSAFAAKPITAAQEKSAALVQQMLKADPLAPFQITDDGTALIAQDPKSVMEMGVSRKNGEKEILCEHQATATGKQ